MTAFTDAAARSRVCIAEMRGNADRLIANIGSADAKRKARTLRIQATKWENTIRRFERLLHPEA